MRAAILVVVAACSLDKPTLVADAADAGDDDAACTTFSTQIDTCQLPAAASPISITANATYDTTLGMLTIIGNEPVPVQHVQTTGPNGPLDVIVCRSFDIKKGATLRITGTSVGLVSEGTISLDGEIDVSVGGAGARTKCTPGASDGMAGNTGGGGGGGGFGSVGGDGSPGGGGGSSPGMRGGIETLPALIAGGCPGGDGGPAGVGGGLGGLGGGGIFVASKLPMSVTGRILAGGGGGKAASTPGGGGGGGGTGGMILIESPMTTVNTGAVVAANGGGGGEGEEAAVGGAGQDGQDGLPSGSPAIGGAGGSLAGNGGNGASAMAGASNGAMSNSPSGGGGGGGGGAGYISILNASIVVGAIVSPAAGSAP